MSAFAPVVDYFTSETIENSTCPTHVFIDFYIRTNKACLPAATFVFRSIIFITFHSRRLQSFSDQCAVRDRQLSHCLLHNYSYYFVRKNTRFIGKKTTTGPGLVGARESYGGK